MLFTEKTSKNSKSYARSFVRELINYRWEGIGRLRIPSMSGVMMYVQGRLYHPTASQSRHFYGSNHEQQFPRVLAFFPFLLYRMKLTFHKLFTERILSPILKAPPIKELCFVDERLASTPGEAGSAPPLIVPTTPPQSMSGALSLWVRPDYV